MDAEERNRRDPLPVGWERVQRAILDARVFDGRPVQHIVGWQVVRRACGCMIELGMRLDRNEMTSGVVPCPQHGAQGQRALDVLLHMPPSEQEVGQLFAQILERELELSP